MCLLRRIRRTMKRPISCFLPTRRNLKRLQYRFFLFSYSPSAPSLLSLYSDVYNLPWGLSFLVSHHAFSLFEVLYDSMDSTQFPPTPLPSVPKSYLKKKEITSIVLNENLYQEFLSLIIVPLNLFDVWSTPEVNDWHSSRCCTSKRPSLISSRVSLQTKNRTVYPLVLLRSTLVLEEDQHPIAQDYCEIERKYGQREVWANHLSHF